MSEKRITVPRGTKDILPEEIGHWQLLESKARAQLTAYGFNEIRTPIYEESRLFKRSLGQSSEVVNKQLLELATEKEDSQALRPEGTAPIVRSYIEQGLDRKEYVSKLFYIGPMFRGERPQKGRLRQFHQIGAESIGWGANHPLVDAEMIALATDILKSFGVNDYKLKINSLGSAEDKANFATWLRDALKDKIGSLSQECQDQYERNVFRLLDSKDLQCQAVINDLNIADQHLSEEGRDYFEQVKKALTKLGIAFEVSSSLVRGLDYYTHTVFEFSCSSLGAQDAIGAGGRYNGLIEQLGGGDKRFEGQVGAIGFALGLERILLALGLDESNSSQAIDAYMVSASPDVESQAFEIAQSLRAAGVRVDIDLGGRKFKKQMERANQLNAKYVLILGEEEINNQTVTVKNMSSGDQEQIALDKLKEYLS